MIFTDLEFQSSIGSYDQAGLSTHAVRRRLAHLKQHINFLRSVLDEGCDTSSAVF